MVQFCSLISRLRCPKNSGICDKTRERGTGRDRYERTGSHRLRRENTDSSAQPHFFLLNTESGRAARAESSAERNWKKKIIGRHSCIKAGLYCVWSGKGVPNKVRMTSYGCPSCKVPLCISVRPNRRNNCGTIWHSTYTVKPRHVIDTVLSPTPDIAETTSVYLEQDIAPIEAEFLSVLLLLQRILLTATILRVHCPTLCPRYILLPADHMSPWCGNEHAPCGSGKMRNHVKTTL